MAGIYIHIPFCKKACHYCDFHFSTSLHYTDEMVEAICNEAEIRSKYINEQVTTVYFGGGTPSLLTADQLQQILIKLKALFLISAEAEITLEANPDDITKEKLFTWKYSGINRLSIGIQSFFDKDLQWMNRAHNAGQAMESIQLTLQVFNNVTIDLIYGTPVLSDEEWRENVSTVFSLNVPHISCYALTVEPKTALHKMILQNKKNNINADQQSRHFELLISWMRDAGYMHYEISNFAKTGYRSKHNSSYWEGKDYLGLGPSAHSFNGKSRQWNVANNALYVQSIKQKIAPFEMETLTPIQQLNEYIMTSLRTMEGISLEHLQNFKSSEAERIIRSAQKFVGNELITYNHNRLRLTDKGKLFADGIAAELFHEAEVV